MSGPIDGPNVARCPVFLVRHGQSEWNVARLTQGQTMHPALTAAGRADARAAGGLLALALAGGPRPLVWSSDLVRAEQTAQAVVAALAPSFGALEVVLDKRLREQDLGDLEGRSYEETWAAGEAHDWSDPTLPVAGGESPAQVHARMGEVVAQAAQVASGTGGLGDVPVARPVVLVSHGDAIRVALAQASGHGPGEGEWIEVPNGAVFRLDPGHPPVRLT